MRLIDTHCHIDLDSFDEDRDRVFDRAADAGVSDLLVIGFEPERWNAALELAGCRRNVRVAAGIHPNSVGTYTPEMLDEIARVAQRSEVVAIGEIGIDLYWKEVPLADQQRAFREQIALARELGMPFIIHQRDAEQEVLDILRSFPAPLSGVLHCFTSGWHYAEQILDLGLHIGLGGAITFKSRTELHEAASRIPLERIVLETDAPFMAPVPYRGKRNEPAYVALIAERLAELQGRHVDEIARLTSETAMALFPGLGTRP